jgi:hypothetical protein
MPLRIFRATCFVVGAMLAACSTGSIEPAATTGVSNGPMRSVQRTTGVPLLYVADYQNSRVTIYDPNSGALLDTLKDGTNRPTLLAFDSLGNLYVACSHRVEVFPPGQSSPSEIIKVPTPSAIALDSSDNLYVATAHYIQVYAVRTRTPMRTITDGVNFPTSEVFDADGNLYVSNAEGGVTVYGPGSDSVLRTISEGIGNPRSMTIDATGYLYVANYNDVTVYKPKASSPWLTVTGISPDRLAIDAKNNLYVAVGSNPNGAVNVYSQRGKTFERTVSTGIEGPVSLVVDASGLLYVANKGANAVTKYSQGGKSLLKTISSKAMKQPDAVALQP